MDLGHDIASARSIANLPVPYRAPHLLLSRKGAGTSHPPAIRVTAESHRPINAAPLVAALSAYAEGEVRDALRLPAGFFRSRLV